MNTSPQTPNKDSLNLFTQLAHLKKMGTGIGLHRMSWLMSDVFNDPWFKNLHSIRVTGSNGKGSVCAMLASILGAMQIGYGLYTSPHLIRFNERFSISGTMISDQELISTINSYLIREKAYNHIYPYDNIGSFEAITAIALYYFARNKPSTVISEVGIGGRYDPTRIIPGNLVGLTSIELEHIELLGDRLELIAYDKCDLCPDGGTLVVGMTNAEILRRLHSYCNIKKVNLISTKETVHVNSVNFTNTTTVADLQIEDLFFKNLEIGLLGDHQVNNATVAILLARKWLKQEKRYISDHEFEQGVYKGLLAVKWPGRFECIGKNPDIYIDVGHTPDAIEYVVRTVGNVLPNRPILLITGVSLDKQMEKIVSKLVTIADEVICTRAYHKGGDVSKISSLVRRERPNTPVYEASTIEQATSLALELAKKNDMTILVAGGLFLAIEAMRAFQGKDPQALHFH